MSSFSKSTIQSCIKLRDELHNILKCIYCNKILQSARTLNCSHHVCESCANKQLSNEGECISCNCTYFTKDITNNVSINNIIEVFHNLSSNIENAANIFNIKISQLNNNNQKEEKESDSESDSESESDDDLNYNNKTRKRKSFSNTNENQEIDLPKAKKRKLNNVNNIFIPKEICMTGFDQNSHKLFESYANKFGIILNKNWKIGATEMLITKHNPTDNSPKVSFKVLASILCGIPIVKQSYLTDSYNKGEILDYNKYICNYKRVCNNNGIFNGLNILFATTDMKPQRLKTLLKLGKANIIETQQEINCKDPNMFNKRIMICHHDTEWEQAKTLSTKYNCRIISESWVIKCIYQNEFDQNNYNCYNSQIINYYEMEPITDRISFNEFDKTIKPLDDSESDLSEDDSSDDSD